MAGTLEIGTLNIESTDNLHKATVVNSGTTNTTIDVSTYSPFTGFKNYIINGNFDVWQRGTSFSTSIGYGADRWWWSTADTISVNKTIFNEQKNALSIAKSTTVDSCYIAQSIEDVRTVAGKSVTLSFYAKANASTTLKVFGYQLFGTGGSSAVSIPVQTGTLTTSWTKYTFTFAIPSVEGKTIGTNNNLRISIQFGADNTWTGTGYLAQVQLEEGSVATPFEQRPYGLELKMCQYYARPIPSSWDIALGSGYVYGQFHMTFEPMRVTPTVTTIGTFTAGGGANGVPLIGVSNGHLGITNNSNNWTPGNGIGYSGGFLSAEL